MYIHMYICAAARDEREPQDAVSLPGSLQHLILLLLLLLLLLLTIPITIIIVELTTSVLRKLLF